MRYLLCFILPPLAVLSTGRFREFILNMILCVFYLVPGIIHAVLVTYNASRDRRSRDVFGDLDSGRRF